MKHETETAWAQETNLDGVRLYDTLTIPCNSDGAPCNLAAELGYMTQAQLHEAVMYPLYKGYSRDINWDGLRGKIRVATYDESGVLYELLVIGRAS
jgi:hypothetical protein